MIFMLIQLDDTFLFLSIVYVRCGLRPQQVQVDMNALGTSF